MSNHDTPLPPHVPGIAEMQLRAASGHYADEAAIFILQPHTLQVRDAQDQVEIPDAVEYLVRRTGGQQLTTTSLFTPPAHPGLERRAATARRGPRDPFPGHELPLRRLHAVAVHVAARCRRHR
jgi:hypothetical protein